MTMLVPPVVPFYPFLGEGSPTKIDYRKKGTHILNSLLEGLDDVPYSFAGGVPQVKNQSQTWLDYCASVPAPSCSRYFLAGSVMQTPE